MRRWAWVVMVLAACTSSTSEPSSASQPSSAATSRSAATRAEAAIPDWPTDVQPPSQPGPPTEPIGQPGDEPWRWSASGSWVAICRAVGAEGSELRLLVGPRIDVRMDWVGAADPSGRYLIARRDEHVVLVDAATAGVDTLGTRDEVIPGAFDARGEHLAHGVRDRSGGSQTVVVRALATKREQRIPSPIRSLRRVELDRSGRFVWLQGSTPVEEEPAPRPSTDDSPCAPPSRGESAGIMAHVEEAAIDLGADEPAVISGKPTLRTALFGFRALGDALVTDDGGLALRSSSGITTIDREGCSLEHVDDTRGFLLLACVEQGELRRYWSWHDGALHPLGFWRTAWVSPLGPEELRVVRGRNDTWLSMPAQGVVTPGGGYTQGHAFERHVVLVGEAGVEVRDATSNTVTAHHDLDVVITKIAGPIVLLSPREGGTGSWVLDLRDGTQPRRVEGPVLALSNDGHVAVRDHGRRLRWR